MKFLRRNYLRNFIILIILCFCIYTASLHYQLNTSNKGRSDIHVEKPHFNLLRKEDKKEYFSNPQIILSRTEKVSWENETAIRLESLQTGIGEQGEKSALPPGLEQKKQDLWDTNGFNGLLSDLIALNRSLKDMRHEKCKEYKYSKVLPTVSVVIPFFEEHLSTLLRTVVSVVNRSPPSLLKQIILVDDGSTMKESLKSPLDDWVSKNQPKTQVLRLPTRMGLIAARQEGAKLATADAIVVLDSHCEVMAGWLPPLLEPIVENPKTAVCPLIDVINSENFAYYPQDNGGRGAFDWRFFYKRLSLFPEDIAKLPQPFENPVMNGGLFAINRKFFWELGGYDTGITIWGGEQYNLSFKIWQCGGRLLDAPCSRVGHIFRHGGKKRPAAKNAGDFISVNYKRVAVVWMDEFAEALYRKKPQLRNVDPGDVSAEMAVRERLQCKSFSWFLKNVAPDLVKIYPPVEPDDFANGTIQSVESPSLCVDTAQKESGDLVLYGCHGMGPQYFSLGWQKTIKVESEQFCWISPRTLGKSPQIAHCQRDPPSQFIWRYDPITKTIKDKSYKRCLESHPSSRTLSMEQCDISRTSQKWRFKFINLPMILENYPKL